MRYFFLVIILLVVILLFLQGYFSESKIILPVFLKEDTIAELHSTSLKINIRSVYKPQATQYNNLKKDYCSIWAHLNHLYATNDVEAGKEYYTEDFFKQICSNYNGIVKTYITRIDTSHELNIINWSSDELVCNAIDSNLNFKYIYANNTQKETVATVAMVLLFQGDHWRIDALKILNETPIKKLKLNI